MFKSFPFFFAVVLCLAVIPGNGLPSFPGAEGMGALTPGGRGGQVIHVTNLNDAGSGSFRAALRTGSARIIVFDIGGVIEGQTPFQIGAGMDNVTIAGQTAPGGITLSGAGLEMEYHNGIHDFILRYMRFRGVHNTAVGETEGDWPIAVMYSQNAIVDHCSACWGCDQTINAYDCQNITYQWTISAEAGYGTGGDGCNHPEGGHNYGSLFGGFGSDKQSLHHLLFMHNSERNPLLGNEDPSLHAFFDCRNIVTYGCNKMFHVDNGYSPNCGHLTVNVIGNYYDPAYAPARYPCYFCIECAGTVSMYFDPDNLFAPYPTQDPWDPNVWDQTIYLPEYVDTIYQAEVPVPSQYPPVTTYHPARANVDSVLKYAGCFPRDSADRRFIREFRTNTGSWGKKDAPLQVAGMGTPSPTDTDRDGMPDAWETANGLNPSVADDKGDFDGTGYTNIEKYINDLAAILINKPTQYPTGGVEDIYNPNYTAGIYSRSGFGGGGSTLLSAFPNPFNKEIRLEMRSAEFGVRNYGIAIYNCSGKLVYSAFRIPNSNIQTWDGKDMAGYQVSPGIYLVRFMDNKRILTTQKILMVE